MIRNPRRGEEEGVLLDLDDLVGIFGAVTAAYEANFVVRAAVIGHDTFSSDRLDVFDPKYIEMADLAGDSVGQDVAMGVGGACGDLLIELFKGGDGRVVVC